MSSLLPLIILALTVSVYVEGLGYWPIYATAPATGSQEDDDRQQETGYYTYPPDSLPGLIAGQVQQVVDYIYGVEEVESEEEPTTTPPPTTTRKKRPGKRRK